MRRRQVMELAVGTGLLLGPLVFALTLPRPGAAPSVCPADPSPPAEVVIVEVCEDTEPKVEVEPEPEPEPEPEVIPEPELTPEPTPEPTPHEGASEFLFVSDVGLVLSAEAKPRWGTGAFYEPEGEATYRVAKHASPTRLPAALWAQRGRSFDLYDGAGKVCTARVDELHVINQYGGWGLDGIMGDAAWSEYESPDEIPRAVWREALWKAGGHWLVADIISSESCAGALWARDASLPSPAILRTSDEETAAGEARLAQFERSELLAETRESYERWYAELPAESLEYEIDWTKMASTNPATVSSWVNGAGVVQLVELDFGTDMEGCGDGYDARITSLELAREEGFVDTEHGPGVSAIFDADLDGQLEYLYVSRWDPAGMSLYSDSESLQLGLTVDQDFECPC